MDKTNMIENDLIPDDAVIIYCDEENEIRFCGDPKFLANKEHYIKVSIKRGIFTISSTRELDFSDDRCMYFSSLEDCDFKRFILNYLIFRRVPGIYLLDIGDVFIDMKHTAESIDKIIKDHVLLPEYDDEPPIISNLTDLYYMSDYSDQSYQVKSEDYLLLKKLIGSSLNKLREDPAIAVQVDDLKNYIDNFIDIISMSEFRNGYNVGKDLTKGILTTPPGSIRIDVPNDHFEWKDDTGDLDNSE